MPMIRLLPIAAVLCFAHGAFAQQTSIAPSPTPAGATSAKPAAGTPPAGAPASRNRRSSVLTGVRQPVASASTAHVPLGNSKIEVIGNPQHPGQPSDDKPMLPIATVPNPLGLRSGTPICVRLKATADSGHLRNGDIVNATLAAPLGGLPKGTPVQLTVVQAAPAGFIVSYGELSLQVTGIGNYAVLSDIVTALGKEGAKTIADAAPAIGTEAEFAAGQDFTFPTA